MFVSASGLVFKLDQSPNEKQQKNKPHDLKDGHDWKKMINFA